MTDIVDAATRSRMMSGIRGKDTKPELQVRSYLHSCGFRFRLHARGLPGAPDIVFPKHNAVVLVHGCFWHMHSCDAFRLPGTRTEFWREKLSANKARDLRNIEALKLMGWRVAVVWECGLKAANATGRSSALARLAAWMDSTRKTIEIPRARR